MVNAGDLIKAVTYGNHLGTFTDDTYLIVPSGNEGSRLAEIDSIQSRDVGEAKQPDAIAKPQENKRNCVFVDNNRKRHFVSPPLLPEIDRPAG